MSRSVVLLSLALWCAWRAPVAASAASASCPKASHLRGEHFGLVPDTDKDSTPALNAALTCIHHNNAKSLQLSPGRYHFHAEQAARATLHISNTNNEAPERRIPLYLRDLKNFTLDGGGAQFIFHGRVTPLVLEGTRNVTLKNFSIDWQRPFISQGEISAVADNYVEIRFNADAYPYRIQDQHVWFTGEDWAYQGGLHLLVNADHSLLRDLLDEPLGERFFRQPVTEMQRGILRFHGQPMPAAKVGREIVWRHGKGDQVGVLIYRSDNTRLEDVTLYHAPGKALMGQRCNGVELVRTHTRINSDRQRHFSSYADALHFSGCKGSLRIREADNTGQMDDWLNVHGTYTTVTESTPTQLRGRFHHHESRNLLLFEPGDQLRVLDPLSGKERARAVVTGFSLQPPEHYQLQLRYLGHTQARPDDILENLTWIPNLTVQDSHLGNTFRARGMLLTSAGTIVLERNHFATAGTPILIEADTHRWFESGAVNDMLIRDNLFRDTFSSGIVKAKLMAPHDPEYYWGDASVLSVTPGFRDGAVATGFHRNIRLLNNRFENLPLPLVHAVGTDGLHLQGNTGTVYQHALAPQAMPVVFLKASTGFSARDNRLSGPLQGGVRFTDDSPTAADAVQSDWPLRRAADSQ